jgi:hypothetical protein
MLLLAGCAGPQISTLATMTLSNEQGHVIGRRDIVQNVETRETWSNYTLYTPVANDRGQVVAYEEQVSDGTIRYGLNGRKIGGHLKDLRSGSSFGVVVKRSD